MVDQFHDSKPALANKISDDVPDMAEMFGYIKDVFQNFCKGWSNTVSSNIYPYILKDDDEDTMIQLEESADEDIIRFDTGGTQRVVIDASGNVGVGVEPTANMTGLALEAGALTIKEITTPTADTNYGKVYCKSDNRLYFQDGAGSEHQIAYV